MDVRNALAALRVPTLVIHRIGDRLIGIDHARAMAGLIEDARMLELPGDWHVNGRVGADDDVFDAIEEFVVGDATVRRRDIDRVLATVLFTDIVDSTSQAASSGDRSWRALLEQHDDVARRHVERFGGAVVTRTGDGLLATFDGPGRAVRAAQAIVESVQPLGLGVRAGLHTCEIERRDRDVSGIGVHIGARIAALANTNEVLVSNTVKDLVMGSDIEFRDRGGRALKGVPGEWRLWAAV
jgi:class 3 adenylate cyclase